MTSMWPRIKRALRELPEGFRFKVGNQARVSKEVPSPEQGFALFAEIAQQRSRGVTTNDDSKGAEGV